MKKFWKFMMFAVLGVFTMASCEDVPEPYIIPGNSSTPEQEVEPTGDGTATSPFNVKAVQAFIEEGDYANKEVYIEGIITSFKEAPGNQYGNATFYIADTPAGKNTFYIYRTYGLNGEKFTDASNLAVGDTVVIRSTVTNYNGTFETEQNKGRIISINGKTEYPGGNGNNNDEGEENAEPTGEGTLESPYNVAAAINYINTLGADKESANEVYVKGIVKANSTTEATISQYGNMTFTMVDEGSNATFTAFQVYGPGKKKFTSVDQIKEGDEVIVCGKVVNYKGNTPETVGKGASYVYSINGKSEDAGNDNQPGTDQPATGTEISCAKAAELTMQLDDKAESAETYTVVGYITETDGKISRDQQTFWMADTKDGGKVFEAYWANIPDPTAALPVGTKVKMTGKLMRYGSTPEMKNGTVIVLEMGEGGNEDNNDDNQPSTGDTNEYTTNVSYTLGAANAYDDGIATVNGVEGVKVIKIGTSKNPGDFTIKSTTGKVSFYAVTWKGATSADVLFKDGDNLIETVNVKANEGAANNSPYTFTVSSADKYEINVPAGKTITVTSDKRIIFFGIQNK